MADICGIYGLQGCGKTMTLTALAKQRYHQGRRLYSNYHLKGGLEYEPVKTLEDMNNMRHGTFLADELWVWLNARTSMRKMNRQITRIVMLNRKRDVDIFYTCQLPRTADILLREVTTTWIKPHIIPLRDTQTGEKSAGVKCIEINSLGEIVNKFRLKEDLDYWGQFYDTREEIGDIKKDNERGRQTLQKGIELEKDNEKAAKKLEWINGVVRMRESGRFSPKKWDLDYYTDLGLNLAVDVKASNKRRVSAWPRDAEKQIQIAQKFNFLPFIAFPEYDKKQTTNPKYWHLHYLGDTYITDNKTRPAYKKLVQHSTRLTELHTYLKKLASDISAKNVAV